MVPKGSFHLFRLICPKGKYTSYHIYLIEQNVACGNALKKNCRINVWFNSFLPKFGSE